MTDEKLDTKSIPLPKFDGEDASFEVWWPKFEAYANLKGFSESIEGAGDPELPKKEDTLSSDADTKKIQQRAIIKNKLAVSSFTMAFNTVALMNRIEKSKTTNYPRGLASLITEQLMKKYRPQDRASKLEALRDLSLIKMTDDDEPDKIFNEIAALQQKYVNSGLSEEALVNHIMLIAPDMYNDRLTSASETQGANLKLDHLQVAMNARYRLSQIKDDIMETTSTKNEEGTESALIAKFQESIKNMDEATMSAFMKQLCYHCGQPGHKAFECPKKKNGSGRGYGGRGGGYRGGRGGRGYGGRGRGKFQGKCNNCGKQGHKMADCWDLDENKNKRPKDYKTGGNDEKKGSETGNVSIEYTLGSFHENALMENVLICCSCSEQSDNANKSQDDVISLPDVTEDSALVDDNDEDVRVFDLEDDNLDDQETRINDNEDDTEVIEVTDDIVIIEPIYENTHDDEQAVETQETILMVKQLTLQDVLKSDELWVGDTGASTHMTCSNHGMYDTRAGQDGDTMIMGNGTSATATTIGTIDGTIINKNGENAGTVLLKNVTYAPDGEFNLMSLPTLVTDGWTVTVDNNKGMILRRGKQVIKFDVVIKTPRSRIYCLRIQRNSKESAMMITNKPIKIAKLHSMFGHGHEARDRRIAKHLGITVARGTLCPCGACATAKAKRKALPSRGNGNNDGPTPKVHDDEKLPAANMRIYVDLSKIQVPKHLIKIVKHSSKPFWRLAVDEKTELPFCAFHAQKNQMAEPMCELLDKWRQFGKEVTHIRCDNAGENLQLQQRLNSHDWKYGTIEFEYTAKATPQQNSVVEKKFDTLYCRGRAMMIAANVSLKMRYILFREAFETAAKLDGLTIIVIGDKTATRYEHWGNEIPRFAKYLRVWGESGVVKIKTTSTPKLADRGVICMFVGYATNHAGDCYRMFNEDTLKVHLTRDVRWLNRLYYKIDGTKNTDPEILAEDDNELHIETVDVNETNEEATTTVPTPTAANVIDISDDENEAKDSDNENEEGNATQTTATVTPVPMGATTGHGTIITQSGRRASTRMKSKPARLEDEMGGMLLTAEEKEYHAAMCAADEFAIGDNGIPFHNTAYNIVHETGMVGAATMGGFDNTAELKPMKYDEAMKTKDAEGWKVAVKEEWERFGKYNVFQPVKREDVPDDAKFVSTTWAMKKKSNGTLRARLNMRGYEQEDGVHYDGQSIASPVTTDVTVRVILTLMLMCGWTAKLLDVKGAFLHGEFDNGEEIYTEVPDGFEVFIDPLVYVLLLMKTCYGLKQAAKMFWKELLKAMNYLKFTRSQCDPCLYWKDTMLGMVIWLSWVDDCLCIGPENDVIKAKSQMKELFDCDDVGDFHEYVGCKIDYKPEDMSLKFTQPVMIQSFQDEFKLPDYEYESPAESGQVLVAVVKGQELSGSNQSIYRSGVGKLLHMMRWSRPEIWNAVRETSRRMQIASRAHLAAMLRIMKYCIMTKDDGWVLKPSRKWDGKDKSFKFNIRGKSDSNYATCKETRRSVTGYVVYLEDSLISVKSGMQKLVALSVSEAEIIALVQCVQEIMFVKKLIESLKLQVQLPIEIEVDNKATVDLVNGWSIAGGTKHSEVKIMYLRELKEKGIIRVYWHPTTENESDIYTKNLDIKSFIKHKNTLMGNKEYE